MCIHTYLCKCCCKQFVYIGLDIEAGIDIIDTDIDTDTNVGADTGTGIDIDADMDMCVLYTCTPTHTDGQIDQVQSYSWCLDREIDRDSHRGGRQGQATKWFGDVVPAS